MTLSAISDQQSAAQIPAFYFSREKLSKLAEKYSTDFRTAEPFPHVVIDDFLEESILNQLIEEFPGPEDEAWQIHGAGPTWKTQNRSMEKLALDDETRYGLLTRHFMAQLNSAVFTGFLENLTGVRGLLVDPSYFGCGLHSTGPGGKLMIHTDASRHPSLKLDQCLNLILFMNKDWKEEYGGHLELWDKEAKHCIKKILPVSNRCVIFETSHISYHGHPSPLNCPENRRRNSLAVYYYCLERLRHSAYQGWNTRVDWKVTQPDERFYNAYLRVRGWVQKLKAFVSHK